MNDIKQQIKIIFEGIGFKYCVFEVRDEDVPVFKDTERGVFLRNYFKRYVAEDMRRLARGEAARMIQFFTLVDDAKYPAEVSVIEGQSVHTYHLGKMTEWHFLVTDVSNRQLVEHLPEGMPEVYTQRIKSLLREYVDSFDEMTAEVLNGEYITFFNLYTPEGKMLLCMRSRDIVRSEFEIELPAGESADIDRLCIMCRDAQEVTLTDKSQREYDANNLVYDSRWHSGNASSHRQQNIDYFVYPATPAVLDARWFESWAV